jgi:hypothetical protein
VSPRRDWSVLNWLLQKLCEKEVDLTYLVGFIVGVFVNTVMDVSVPSRQDMSWPCIYIYIYIYIYTYIYIYSLDP